MSESSSSKSSTILRSLQEDLAIKAVHSPHLTSNQCLSNQEDFPSLNLTSAMKSALGFTLVLLAVLAVKAAAAVVQFSYAEEWHMWKTQHGKSYGSVRGELERHLVWLANREYINAHNQNSHIFGFTLAMNHLADIVSSLKHTDHFYEHMKHWQLCAKQYWFIFYLQD